MMLQILSCVKLYVLVFVCLFWLPTKGVNNVWLRSIVCGIDFGIDFSISHSNNRRNGNDQLNWTGPQRPMANIKKKKKIAIKGPPKYHLNGVFGTVLIDRAQNKKQDSQKKISVCDTINWVEHCAVALRWLVLFRRQFESGFLVALFATVSASFFTQTP